MRIVCIALFLFFFLVKASAGGLRGTVKGEDGTLLAFATLYVKELGTGTTTNENGLYEMNLPPGQYHIVFQFILFIQDYIFFI